MGGKQQSRSRETDRSALVEALGVDFDAEMLTLALTHRSYAYENGGLEPNERLEFLGDAVLGLVITDHLYRKHPDLPEGQLAKLRASVVNMHALAGVARELGEGGLGQYLLLGRGEELTGGRDKASILADSLEAVLGAVYLQHGLETSRSVIHRLFDSLLAEAPMLGAGLDWKTSLQELTASAGLGVPDYRIDEQGPDHRKEFSAYAVVNGEVRGQGDGRTKKDAEQKAAQTAWRALSDQLNAESGDPQDSS
ncbi:RNAse III [Actinopolyspora xinjiangensis]|uniref:Ribonuclease 3 n=1 Tax=Actinopolyspora xinjiangensis TaxID=405564 RepID=A0A1H0T1W2_9ACTN|nr:ribonuclease III [Actinopolyspora xinjiangensis]SDP47969.1 RNAse III [Actinopolyspora xinjiangensis]